MSFRECRMPEAQFPGTSLLGSWVNRGRPGPVTQASPVRYMAAMLEPVYRKGIVPWTPARAPRIYRSATFEASPTKGMLMRPGPLSMGSGTTSISGGPGLSPPSLRLTLGRGMLMVPARFSHSFPNNSVWTFYHLEAGRGYAPVRGKPRAPGGKARENPCDRLPPFL